MNRSFQGPKRIRLNEICEEARNVPEWVAREALGKKSFPDKEMPCWIWISGIAATVTIGASRGGQKLYFTTQLPTFRTYTFSLLAITL